MEVKELKITDTSVWDAFVDLANYATIFHKIKFLSYHPPSKFNFSYLAFYNKTKLIALLPGGIDSDVYKSPLGASYGSFATSTLSFNEYEELVDTFLEYMQNKVNKISLTPPPIIYGREPNQLESFILVYKNFQIKEQLISHAVNLNIFASENDILNSVKKRFRNDVNKSLRKDLTIIENHDYSSFYKLLIENKRKFNAKPTHKLKELLTLSKLLPDSLKLFMAYNQDQTPIAGVLLFIVNKTTVLVFYICQDYSYQEMNAVSRLLYECVRWSKKNGYTWFDLGVSMDTFSTNPMEPSRNLIFFKEGLQAQSFLRTTYEYTYE